MKFGCLECVIPPNPLQLGLYKSCTTTAWTLLPIIQAHVAPGTIIHSDMWSSYHRVAQLPNVASHGTVNHSVEFQQYYRCPHSKHRELLEPHKDQAEEDEGRKPARSSFQVTWMSLCGERGIVACRRELPGMSSFLI